MRLKKLLSLFLLTGISGTIIVLQFSSCSTKEEDINYNSTIEQGQDCLDYSCETEESLTVERNITTYLPVTNPIGEIIPGDNIFYIQTDKGPLQINKNKEYSFCIDYNLDPRYKRFFQKSFDYFSSDEIWEGTGISFKEMYEKDSDCCDFSMSLADIENINVLGKNSFVAGRDRKVKSSNIIINRLYYDRLIYNKSAKVREVGNLSLLQTLVHELGHTIGLRDLDVKAGIGSKSLMSYSYNLNDWQFTELDLKNIEMLYKN